MELKQKVLYNPNGDDSDKRLVGANTTNILNLADISKPIYVNLFKQSFSNNWIPDKVSDMSADKIDYENRLTDDEREAYDNLLSFLIYMDTIQTNNLPNIAKYVTLSEAVMMFARQTYDECLIAGHEVLTPNGWKDISKLSDTETILTYDKETGTKKFDTITKYHKYIYKGKLHHFNSKHMEQITTDNHRVPYYNNETGVIEIKYAKEFKQGTQPYKFITDGSVLDKDNDITNSILKPYERLLVAINAKGKIYKDDFDNDERDAVRVSFRIKELRHLNLLLTLITELGYKHRLTTYKRKYGTGYYLKVYIPKTNKVITKRLDWVKLNKVDMVFCNDFINELIFWYGYWYNNSENDKKYAGIDIKNVKDVNVITSLVSILGGYVDTEIITKVRKGKTYTKYRLTFIDRGIEEDTVVKTEMKLKEPIDIYCVTVPTGLFVVRYNSKVSVTGNSIHSYSYGYILSNMMETERFNKIIYAWKDNKVLENRNRYIAKLYEDHVDGNTKKAFLILLIANYLLESIYFYTAFYFFHNLAYRGLMKSTNVQIKYIKRDELLHTTFFKHLILQFREENPEAWDEDLVLSMFEDAIARDMAFTKEIIGDKILGMSKTTIEEYTYFNANKRLALIGSNEIFPKSDNPYKHLDMIASIEDESSSKSNSFEVTSINYKQANAFKGWLKFTRKKLLRSMEKETNPEELKLMELELRAIDENIEKENNK